MLLWLLETQTIWHAVSMVAKMPWSSTVTHARYFCARVVSHMDLLVKNQSIATTPTWKYEMLTICSRFDTSVACIKLRSCYPLPTTGGISADKLRMPRLARN